MRKLAVLVMLALVVPAMADPLQVGSVTKVVDHGANSRGIVVYDDTWSPSGYAYTATLGTALGDELFLDLSQAPPGYTTLDDLTFSVGSFDATPLTSADISVDIFNFNPGTGVFDFAGNISLPGTQFPGLPGGYFTAITLNNLNTLAPPIVVTDDILVTITATNANVGITKIGQLIYDPPAPGSSGDYFYMNGGFYWFGGAPVANFYWGVGVIPEPASLLLLALGGLTLARRR